MKGEKERERRQRQALAAQSAKRIHGMVELAQSEPGIAVTPDALDRDPWLLNVENGTLDLHTGELRRHRPDDLITKLAPVVYDPAAECATWEVFLKRIMNGNMELVRYLQRIFGYALTGDTREQCFFIFHGNGANGKSTLMTAISRAVGNYAQHTPTQTILVKRGDAIPNDVARLYGSRLVTAAEAEASGRLAEALLKQLTGQDPMVARFLHGEWFEFAPTFKLFVAVNHKPDIRGTENAIWRRVKLIPFEVTIPDEEQDKTLPEKLEAEKAGILRWAVEGALMWLRDELRQPQEVTESTASYRDEMDVLGPWIAENCVLDPTAKETLANLYGDYAGAWCRMNEEKPISQKDFMARLQEKGIRPGRTMRGRFWQGVALSAGRLGDMTA